MTKRALLIGSQIDGLTGVDNDVRAIGDRLRARGFDLEIRQGADAARDGIAGAYARLIRDSRAADAALVYYSGHGCRLENAAPKIGERSVVQCLVPTNWTASGNFQGIVDLELSTWMHALTQKTQNVVSIFDSCHAATVSRSVETDPAAVMPKFTQRYWDEPFREFLATLALDSAALAVESNPNAVRLGATEADRSAYEGEHVLCGQRQRMGHFTWALAIVLDEVCDTPITWSALMSRVRELVMRISAMQCPQLEGPGERLLFSADTLRRRDAVVFFQDADGRPMLRASRLIGAVPGVVYDLLPQTAPDYDPAAAFATATVVENIGAASLVALGPEERAREPQSGDLAYPRKHPFPTLSAAVRGDVPLAEIARERVRRSRFLDAPTPGEMPCLTLIATPDGLSLVDVEERQITTAWPATERGVELAVSVAERWSRSRALLALQSNGFAASPIDLAWGRVEDSQRIPMCVGDTLYIGDRIYIDVVNRTNENLWLAIFDVGVTGKITLLTSATSRGRKLGPAGHIEGRYSLGERFGKLAGVGPGALPADAPQQLAAYPETFVVVVSTDSADFFVFETSELSRAARRSDGFDFGDLLEQLRDGSTRDFGAEQVTSKFSVQRLDFSLAPATRWTQPQPLAARGVIASEGPREPARITRLRVSDLCPGDVLLSLGSSSTADVIQGLDGGWYSHAALWSGSDVVEATDPAVQRGTLADSIRTGNRKYVDVYRHSQASPAQREQVVANALHYVGRTYAWGDLMLGGFIVGSGAFLFRGRELDQRAWLRAMQVLNRFLRLDRERAHELVTCAELVARSYQAADLPLEICLRGLRRYEGVDVGAAIRELASHHLPPISKGGEMDVLAVVELFQNKRVELLGGHVQVLIPESGPTARGAGDTASVGRDWGANLVTPRDLMQSRELELVGTLHP